VKSEKSDEKMVSISRLKQILSEFKNKNIAVLGDMMLDEYIIGEVDRISPEAPVPVVNVKTESYVLGGAANVINNLHNLGSKVTAFGIIGQDDTGKKLEKELEKKKIDTEGIIEDKDRPTIVKKRVIAHNQQLLRLDWENKKAIDLYMESRILEILRQKIDKIDALILSDYNKGFLTAGLVKELIKLANEKNKYIVVDPKPDNVLNYIGATSMTPNTKEAISCNNGKEIENEKDFETMGQKLREKLSLENILITRSEKGMSLFGKEEIKSIPTFAKEVYDVTGAGDTVISVFTLAAASGASFYEAAKIANAAAGIVVGRIGTSTLTIDELVEFYSELYKD
jgi:rfaE bifunctional protein kinase chain/domain